MTDKRSKFKVIEGGKSKGGLKVSELFPSYANLDLDESEVNALSRRQRLELLDRLDYRRKYQLLNKADDMLRLVREMSPEDLNFTIDAAGRNDAMDLVLAATPAQFTALLDLNSWHGDIFDADDMLDWLGYLIMVDPERAIGKVRALDPDYFLLLVGNYIRVHRYEWHEYSNHVNDDSLFSLDDIYLIELLDPDSPKNERFVVLLQMLYRLNVDLYRTILEALLWELPSAIEERNLRDHGDRMADHGYPAYLDSLGLLSPINPEAVRKRLAEKRPDKKGATTNIGSLPSIFRGMLDEESFFTRCLAALSDDLRLVIRDEMVYLGNRLLVVRKAMSELDLARDAAEEAHFTLSLGLEYLADSDPDRGAAILTTTKLAEIFRVGYSLVLRLHNEALHFGESVLGPMGRKSLGLISSPGRESFNGLLQSPPRFNTAVLGDDEQKVRPFRRLDELQKTETLLRRLVFLFDLHFRILALDSKAVLKGRAEIGLEPLDADLRFVKLFMTAAVRGLSGLEADYLAINAEQFEAFLSEALIPIDSKGYAVNEKYSQKLRSWIAALVAEESEGYRYLSAEWADRCFGLLERLASGLEGLDRKSAISLSRILLLG